MSNLLLDGNDLSHLRNVQVNQLQMINTLYIHAQETIAAGDKVILFHMENGQKAQDEIVSTKAELDAFITRHFPEYVEEINAAADAIGGLLVIGSN